MLELARLADVVGLDLVTFQAAGQHLIDVHDHLRGELTQLRDLIEQVANGALDPGVARSHINEMTMRQNDWTLGIIAHGGATFVQGLARAGLVDEYRLVINPVALGDGLPLFKDLGAPLQLKLVEATTYATGAALHIYRPIT